MIHYFMNFVYGDSLGAYKLQNIFQENTAVFMKQITNEIFMLSEVYKRQN